MTISDKKHVSVSYELRINNKDSEIIEKTQDENPLSFICGLGQMIPKFEENLFDQKAGDKFDFMLEPTEAYGEYNEKAIVPIPADVFMENGKLNEELVKIGNTIPMGTKDGGVMHGVVKEIATENVTMDFNHPLAGNKLFFAGEVLSVREATKEELNQHDHECTGCGKH